MRHISLNITDELHQQIHAKAQEVVPEIEKIKTSDAVRILLSYAIEQLETKSLKSNIQDKKFQYMITTYYLINEYVASLGEQGAQMNNKAHEKAEKIIAALK